MLKNPPCIRLLVGCLETEATYDDTDDGSTGLTLGGTSRSSSSRTSSASSTRTDRSLGTDSSVPSTSLSELSARLPSFASGTLIQRSAKEYIARYTITARNIGSSALQGIKISHGPLPFGAQFDPLKSDRLCTLNAKTVECTLDLASGAQRDLSVTYTAGGSMSCAFARLLEKAKVTLTSITGSARASSVVTSVTCRMESVDRATDGGFGTIVASNPVSGALGQGSGKLIGSSDFKDSGFKQSYKEYPAIAPRTGALHDFFASTQTPKNMIIQHQDEKLHFSTMPILILSVLSVIVVFGLLKRSFGQIS